VVWVKPCAPGTRNGGSLNEDEFSLRIDPACDVCRAGGTDGGGEGPIASAKLPDNSSRRCDADRAVSVLRGRVGLGPRLGSFPELQRGFARDAMRPSASEKRDLISDQPVVV
jgi:hypothetical protein